MRTGRPRTQQLALAAMHVGEIGKRHLTAPRQTSHACARSSLAGFKDGGDPLPLSDAHRGQAVLGSLGLASGARASSRSVRRWRRADGRSRSRRRACSPASRPIPSSFRTASTWTANASLSSMQSMSVERQARAAEGLVDRGNRADAHFLGVDAGDRHRPDPGQRLQSQLLGLLLRHHETAAAPTLIGELLPAVTDPPAGLKAGGRRARPRPRYRGGCTGPGATGLCGPTSSRPQVGTTSGWNSPPSVAAAASWWLRQANSSCFCAGDPVLRRPGIRRSDPCS